jgi:hypothetical protein
MRLMLASLIAVAGAPLAMAQTPPPASPAPASAPPAATAPASPAQTSASPTVTAPAAASPEATAPAAPAVAAPTPPAPPAPPPPPTDPTAIALLATLQGVCQPALTGGDLPKLAKSAGYHKSGDNFVLNGRGYKFTILAPGSNPDQCHIDMVAPADPAAPVVVALHNWAAVENGWSLYRNDKNTAGNQELITRSWEHDANGRHEALVITTYRRSDDRPLAGSNDTSTVIYSSDKTS